MREISARGTMQYGFQSRVLMSGTPLQNDLTVSPSLCSENIRIANTNCFLGTLDVAQLH